MPGPSEAADMPHRSFLLTPLEATDPTVECSAFEDDSCRPSIFSPTPRKSLFEMSSEDLRAAERAWLQKVESFKEPSLNAVQSSRRLLADLPTQQQDARRSSGTDAHVEESAPPARQSSRSTEDLLHGLGSLIMTEGAGNIKIYRESSYAAHHAPEDPPPLITAKDESSISDERRSLSLRQRYTVLATGLVASSTQLAPESETDSTQDLGPYKVLDPAASSKGKFTQDLKPRRTLDEADVQGAAGLHFLQKLGTRSTPNGGDAQGAADVSPQLKDAVQEVHIPRTPWMGRLKPIRRPSAGWRRTPRKSSQEPPEGVTGAADEAAPSEQTGYRHSSASSSNSGQAEVSDVLDQRHSSGSAEHSTSAEHSLAPEQNDGPARSVDLQDAAAEAWQLQADSEAKEESAAPESAGTDQPLPGMTSPTGYLVGPPDSPDSFALGRHWVPEAGLGGYLGLESACPSAVERLMHPAYHGSVRRSHAPGSTAPSSRSAQQKRLLRGATPEECGVKMYERALVAQQRRQARAEAMRRELEAAASADCTFTPRLNTEKTNKLLWKSLSSPSTMPLPVERRMLQEEPPAVTPRGVPAPRKEIAVQKLDLSKEQGSSRSMSGIKAGQRLYASALNAFERQRTFTSQYIQGELESLRAASPTARSLPKRIYGAAALSRIDLIRSHVISPRRRKPAYEDTVKECTFQPVTTWRSISRASSAAKDLPGIAVKKAGATPEDALSRLLQGSSLKPLDMGLLLGHDSSPWAPSGQAERSKATIDAGQLKSTGKIGALKLQQLGCSQPDKSTSHSRLTGQPCQLGQTGQPALAPGRTSTWQLSECLDFSEFLERQHSHLEMHARHVESDRAQIDKDVHRSLGMSPGSRALFKRWTTVPVHKKQAGYQKPEPLVRSRNAAEQGFRPHITAKARLRRAHTIDELYEGGRARRQHALELLRAESLQAEESQLTFRPSINEHYQTSGPRLKLSNPGPYLAHVQDRAAKRRESLLRAKLAAEEEALKECTYSPRTTKLPAFIERLAQEYAADVQERPVEDDGFASPGSGDEGFGHLYTILQPEWR